MAEPEQRPEQSHGTDDVERVRQRRLRRAAELLGDLEPSRTRDDTDEGWGDRPASTSRDAELRRNVPPHHG